MRGQLDNDQDRRPELLEPTTKLTMTTRGTTPLIRCLESRPESRTSSTRTLTLTTPQEVLRTNRYTWRCLLGMQGEGPGTNVSTTPHCPVADDSVANILATVEDMTFKQRLTFYGSFLRFMRELAQQINELMLEVCVNDDCEENDESAMMQMSLVESQKIRIMLSTVQTSLEAAARHGAQRAGLLQRQLREHFRGVPENNVPGDIAEFCSVLLVLEQEMTRNCTDEVDDMDLEWLKAWWTRIMSELPTRDGGSSSSTLPPPPTTTRTIDLDTQPNGTLDDPINEMRKPRTLSSSSRKHGRRRCAT